MKFVLLRITFLGLPISPHLYILSSGIYVSVCLVLTAQ